MNPEHLSASHIVRPIVQIVRLVLWPVSAIAVRMIARNDQRKLKSDLLAELPFLFAKHRGKFVPNTDVPYPPSFDYAFATVAVDSILVRFCRGRGELDIRIAPAGASPSNWYDLLTVLVSLDRKIAFQPVETLDMAVAARLLEPNLEFIAIAFGERDLNFYERLVVAQTDERIQIKETEWQLNKKFK